MLMRMSETVAAFRGLGDPTRQRLLGLLEEAGESRVSDLAEQFDMTQPSISHHLKILKHAGLVTAERRGKEIYYAIDAEKLRGCCEAFFARFECCRNLLKPTRKRRSKDS
jgi:ArsR family transcriptional regulator